jgi:YihY family inner membrane protein
MSDELIAKRHAAQRGLTEGGRRRDNRSANALRMRVEPKALLKRAVAKTGSHSPRAMPSWFAPLAVASESSDTIRGRMLRVWFIVSSCVRSFIANDEFLWASALTYTTALSIVPILALAFSVLKGFGYSDQLQPLIQQYLALGSADTSKQLMSFINNVNAAALGSAGGAFLLATVITTLGTVERAFNTIFRVPQSRSYVRKFTDYISVLLTVPLFIVAGIALTAFLSVRLIPANAVAHLTPYIFAWAGFFFLFTFFPYTRVSWRAALIGSLVTAVAFQIGQYGYVHFQVGVSRYRAIYGALAELTAAIQRGVPAFALTPLSPEFPRLVALLAMIRLAENQNVAAIPVSYESLAAEMRTGIEAIEPVLDGLKQAGLIVENLEDESASERRIYLCRAPAAITVEQILEPLAPIDAVEVSDARIRKVLEIAQQASRDALRPITLADMLKGGRPETT